MPLSLVLSAASSPADALRAALVHSLHAAHRPELADVVASADLALDFPGVWLRPAAGGLDAAWLERPFGRLGRDRLPLEWVRVLSGAAGQGSGPLRKPRWLPAREAAGLVVPGLRQVPRWSRADGVAAAMTGAGTPAASSAGTGKPSSPGTAAVSSASPIGGSWSTTASRARSECSRQITVCVRCHARVHRRQQLPGDYSDLFFRLWREQHPGRPAQLRLPLAP